MNTISKTSPNVLNERLEQLKKLFPDLFTNEGNLNEEELRSLISKFTTPQTERYEFRWAGKARSKKLAFTPSRAALIPDEKRSVDFAETENLIIEGDNLEVLKLLRQSYSSKVKCIYIDPPYNTGNDFIYNDNYSESKKAYWEKNGIVRDNLKLDSNFESLGRFHSNWLNMIQSRLLLARSLLKEDGVIFVSIDDHEVANLRKLMDEVFGEENFVAQFVWRKTDNQANIGNIARVKEYIVCYTTEQKKLLFHKMRLTERAKKEYRYSDKKGVFRRRILLDKTRGTHTYSIKTPTGKTLNGPWMIQEKEFYILQSNDGIYWTANGDEQPYGKLYLADSEGQITSDLLGIEYGTNQQGSLECEAIFKKRTFDFPKPVSLLKHFFTISTDKNAIILDFFAGSGTTAQAVTDLNNEDKWSRKFIIVQLPEATDEKSEAYKAGFKTISDICIERVKRVGAGFKVFKLSRSYFPENLFSPDPDKTEEENIEEFNRHLEKTEQQLLFEFEENKLLYEIALKDGFNLNFKNEILTEFKENKVRKIKDNIKEALICLDESIAGSTIDLLKPYKEQRFICLKRAVDTTGRWLLQRLLEKNLWVV